MSKLSDQQALFTENIGKLIAYAFSRGYRLTFADGTIDHKGANGNGRKALTSTGSTIFVTDAVHRQNPPSLHYSRRAIDLNLFVKDGLTGSWLYRASDCPEWRDLGKFWEGLHPFCRWGGHFASVDLNHFSFSETAADA